MAAFTVFAFQTTQWFLKVKHEWYSVTKMNGTNVVSWNAFGRVNLPCVLQNWYPSHTHAMEMFSPFFFFFFLLFCKSWCQTLLCYLKTAVFLGSGQPQILSIVWLQAGGPPSQAWAPHMREHVWGPCVMENSRNPTPLVILSYWAAARIWVGVSDWVSEWMNEWLKCSRFSHEINSSCSPDTRNMRLLLNAWQTRSELGF